MSNPHISSGWTSIDDGSDVPVRSTAPSKSTAHDSIVIGSHATETRETKRAGGTQTITEINPHMMQLSAVTGIGLVLLGAAFYFGVLNLRGSVTDMGTTTGVTVTITEQNTFDPASITVPDGSTITFENKNQNPQVLKSENQNSSLFPVQVVFKDSVSVVLDQGKEGTYTYVSETMPKDQKLTIIVQPKELAMPTTETTPGQSATEPENPSLSIPLPFGDSAPAPTMPEPVNVSVAPVNDQASTPSPTFERSPHGAESAVISLGQTNEPVAEPAFTDAPIAINPFTVEAGKKNKNASAVIAQANKKNSALHSGAPLESLRAHKPYRTANTGPENLWILVILSTMGLGITYARSAQKI